MLTKKQHELLTFLHDYISKNGVSPSYDEMKPAIANVSKSGVHRLITALEERGFIRRIPNRARAIEIIRLPPDVGGLRSIQNSKIPSIPLMGRIAAGVPISALQIQTQELSVPPEMLGIGQHYALQVAGDSMIDAGIHDGDVVIIRRQDTVSNGDIAVALIDDEEVTLKRVRHDNGMVVLEPANKKYKPRILASSRVKFQGRLISLLRQY